MGSSIFLYFLSISLSHIANAAPFASPTSIKPFVIDTFKDSKRNDLGYWHGAGEDLPVEYGDSSIRLIASDPDQNFHTQITPSEKCFDLSPYRDQRMFLRVEFSGTPRFGISLNQQNANCDPTRMPHPETWDTVEAERYIAYVPLSHFKIDQSKVLSVSFSGIYRRENLTLYNVEIVDGPPRGFHVPEKLASGRMVLRCSRPNSFAFGIDDGQPKYAQEVMDILADEGIKVTFFAVSTGLRDPSTNFTQVYREMAKKGHQIALHSYSHPKMEGLAELSDIDDELKKSIRTLNETLGLKSRYFRPPFGTVGARTRQRLGALITDPYIVNWSVDIEDWIWTGTDTPEKQLEAFKRDVKKGGNLAVMHYLHPTTVSYMREAIQFVKAQGLDIMRVDQCLEDPESPSLY
ncbi:hypothetical protein ASPZODRAFT_2112210 [Penicilliopsis zonata CBS 506.65]|uniref:NodB homology domain-containing protein n=1 Tax=Penicilliopsis zonata CBS 506.65 TaxID=1073090 RepID=A0A1L9SAL5_9EURO|nr:hypothetical protein ASPZODRAFT_2112210 [Penicilliopsis zonata CBS 506.65]OJJ44235.1 hypothetical protein ASPZODRAFT_2112210 [Penicilliopsis zonata CBS 506.65]